MTDKLKVMLVDDHEVVRQGLRALLEAEEDIEVVAEAGNGPVAVSQASAHQPNVVVMDIRMPEGSGVEACRDIRDQNPDIQVIMLTSFSDDEALFNSIMAGAAGFVLKQIRGRDLVDAIRTVGSGRSLLDPDVTKRVLERLRKAKIDDKDPKLSRPSPQEGADPRHGGRGNDESRDSGADPPFRQDREELRVHDPPEAGSISARWRPRPT